MTNQLDTADTAADTAAAPRTDNASGAAAGATPAAASVAPAPRAPKAAKAMDIPEPEAPREEPRRPERLPGVHLDLNIGGPIVLHFPMLGKKYEGKVVGYEPYSFVIVLARLPQDVLAQAAGGTSMVAQHHAGGMVFGFRTELLKNITNPAALLFLGFPDSVDRIVLRHNQRVSVNLPGTLNGKYGDQKVMVQDMTPTGCQLSAKVDLKSPLREAQVGDRLVLNCEMGCSLPIVAPVELRRVVAEKGLLYIGAQFVDMTPETTEQVNSYVGGLLEFLNH
ncbi:MAG: PilZ domain-containing protein [Proteobacteria bacterium]|nr:PilZ domain-containing protein [Pseudomonadota bacterium]